MKTIKLAYIDLAWWDADKKQLCGDMGFSFCDAPDTRVPIEEANSLRENSIEYINSEGADENCEVGDGRTTDFAIYELCEMEGEYDEEEYNEEEIKDNLWAVSLEFSNVEIKEVFVCATKEDAEGIIKEAYQKQGLWLTAHYRTA